MTAPHFRDTIAAINTLQRAQGWDARTMGDLAERFIGTDPARYAEYAAWLQDIADVENAPTEPHRESAEVAYGDALQHATSHGATRLNAHRFADWYVRDGRFGVEAEYGAWIPPTDDTTGE